MIQEEHFILCGGHVNIQKHWKEIHSIINLPKIKLKPQGFLLKSFHYNKLKYHNLLRYMLTAAMTNLAHRKTDNLSTIYDLKPKLEKYSVMAKLIVYIQNRSLTKFISPPNLPKMTGQHTITILLDILTYGK